MSNNLTRMLSIELIWDRFRGTSILHSCKKWQNYILAFICLAQFGSNNDKGVLNCTYFAGQVACLYEKTQYKPQFATIALITAVSGLI